MEIDLRVLTILKQWKELEKEILTTEAKNAIRNKTATYKYTNYGTTKLEKQTITKYQKDGEAIELNTNDIIAEYCKNNGIKIVKETLNDYKIKIIPSETAKTQFKKMLKDLENSDLKNIAKVATQLQEIIA